MLLRMSVDGHAQTFGVKSRHQPAACRRQQAGGCAADEAVSGKEKQHSLGIRQAQWPLLHLFGPDSDTQFAETETLCDLSRVNAPVLVVVQDDVAHIKGVHRKQEDD